MAALVAVIIFRVVMTIDCCASDAKPIKCLILTSIVPSLLNALAILVLGKVSRANARRVLSAGAGG